MSKYGYKKRVSKVKKLKRLQRHELLARDYPEVFTNMIDVGFEKEKAIEKVEDVSTPLGRLIHRYEANANKPGISSITLEGIRRTSKVNEWIEDMEEQGFIRDKGYCLVFAPNPILFRFQTEW